MGLLFCSYACKNESAQPTKTESTTKVEAENNSVEQPVVEEQSVTRDILSSKLRPNEKLEFGVRYTDTVAFISYDDNYDYWYFLAKKFNDTIDVMYADNEVIKNLVKGDNIVMDWEMQRLQEAGDEDITYIKPYLMSFKKIESFALADTNVKALWRETQYDSVLKANVSSIILNENYLKNISQPEKAALAYVATFIGNDCEWDGEVNADRSNLKCKILSSLDLGYQCSDRHIGFLRKWFAKDSTALEALKPCRTMPNTATIQSTFDEIVIKTSAQDQTIQIRYKVSGIISLVRPSSLL